ncbi:MAG: polysaccharide biosynthesis tyrosine autokinase [Dysgonamonadaceae bacterium]|nr:polysaccharide biosynthesis tyrosine autokinase [Dysgonamonadaceae bacterium]
MEPLSYKKQESNETTAVETLFRYLMHWKLFLAVLVVSCVIAFIFLRYTAQVYQAKTQIIINTDPQKNQTSNYNVSAFSDLGLIAPINSIDNEMAILRSYSLRKEVADSLKLSVSYFSIGRVRNVEIYRNTPANVLIPNIFADGEFVLSENEKGGLVITSEDADFVAETDYDIETSTPWGMVTLTRNPLSDNELPIVVKIEKKILPELDVEMTTKSSSVVNIMTTATVQQKAMDILNTAVALYNKNAINEKNYVANNTSDFIKERLISLSLDLETAEKDVEQFNQEQGIADIQAQKNILLSTTSSYDRQIKENEIQLDLIRQIKAYLLNQANANKVAPANIGLTDRTVIAQIDAYNNEILLREKNTFKMKEEHSILKEYNSRISQLKDNLLNGINIAEQSLIYTIKELNRQETMYLGLSRNLTAQERESRELLRKQSIKETLYNYLSQKLEEVSLTLVQAEPNAKVIDPATEMNLDLYFPKPRNIYLIAFMLGIFIPLLYVYIYNIVDNKVYTKEDVTRVVSAPFLGEIPKMKNPELFPVLRVRSSIAEKFRLITSNLEFMTTESATKVVQVTSTISAEGKSFFARNLALNLATTGKKTLLIDLDMRKSRIRDEIDINAENGISIYLSDPAVNYTDIIDSSGVYHKNLDIIPVLVYPPNPAELLTSNPRMKLLFDTVSRIYDYVIVDTAPIGLVADAFKIDQYVNATIFIIRAGYTIKRSLQDIDEIYRDNKLKYLACVLNATEYSVRYGYGYGYGGYGYGYGYGYGHGYGYGTERDNAKKDSYYTED